MKNVTESLLVTAGNRIICKRCTAKSKRSGEQCKRPALKASRTQKCEFHGGRSTGPKTEAGKARQRASVTTSGSYTEAAIKDKRRSALTLAALEDAMHVLNMTAMLRTRGRKPLGYVKLQTIEDVVRFALDNPLHSQGRSDEREK
jgi:ubiquitin